MAIVADIEAVKCWPVWMTKEASPNMVIICAIFIISGRVPSTTAMLLGGICIQRLSRSTHEADARALRGAAYGSDAPENWVHALYVVAALVGTDPGQGGYRLLRTAGGVAAGIELRRPTMRPSGCAQQRRGLGTG